MSDLSPTSEIQPEAEKKQNQPRKVSVECDRTCGGGAGKRGGVEKRPSCDAMRV